MATVANEPAAGLAMGLIHASTETAFVGDKVVADGTVTCCGEPENVTALFVSPVSKPVAPSVGLPAYVPLCPPVTSAAVVPDVSPRRQYPAGESVWTVCEYPVGGGALVLNVAATDVDALSVTAQVPVPEHPPPDQPANVEPEIATAVRVTAVPVLNVAEHVLPQLIPAGDDVTVPPPVPALATVSVEVGGGELDVPVVQWLEICVVERAGPYTATSSRVPLKNSRCPFHDPISKSLVLTVIAPVRDAGATCDPLMIEALRGAVVGADDVIPACRQRSRPPRLGADGGSRSA